MSANISKLPVGFIVLVFCTTGYANEVCVQASEGIKPIGSSWSMPAKILTKETAQDAIVLYNWLRYIDDLIDDAPSLQEAQKSLQLSRSLVDRIYSDLPEPDVLTAAMRSLVNKQSIPRSLFDSFLKSMEMDVKGVHYDTMEQLEEYCYGSSIVIGRMLAKILGVKDEAKALPHITAIGYALQMTNIARDVKEDFDRDRVYLPEEWLIAEGISSETLMDDESAPARMRVVKRLLDRADTEYRKAEEGYIYIPFRNRLTVAAAGRLYEEVGAVIQKNGDIHVRARVPSGRKRVLFLKTVTKAFFSGLIANP